MPRSVPSLAALAGVLVLGACGIFGGPSAPEPGYEVLRAEPPFELRAYPALAVASTRMGTGLGEGTGGAFRRLFGYISGDNRRDREIAMAAPVIQQPGTDGNGGEEIEMTAPVLQQSDADGQWRMLFVLPPGMTAEKAPVPTEGSVQVDTLPARRVAVVRFSGFLGDANVVEARDRLLAWIKEEGLAPAGPPEVAGYNPPWTLPWFRRNEILVPIEAS